MNFDFILGTAVRNIRPSYNSHPRSLYLTFDDGPDSESTLPILELLAQHQVPATFFVIAEKAQKHESLMRRMQNDQHAVGNHSLDHRYLNFFRGQSALVKWINEAEFSISSQIGAPTVGFRPPAGVRTPELKSALASISMPLILWQHRFYDTQKIWTSNQALKSLSLTSPGAIILLHDRQEKTRITTFLATLETYILRAKQLQFKFEALSRKKCTEQTE